MPANPTPEELVYWLIHFEESGKSDEVFTSGYAAAQRHEQVVDNWNCTLFIEATQLNKAQAEIEKLRADLHEAQNDSAASLREVEHLNEQIATERTARESAERELAEARTANQILTESGVRGHEAVCELAKERDGLVRELAIAKGAVNG